MRGPGVKFTLRRTMASVALLAVLFAICLVPARRFSQLVEYARVRREMNDAITGPQYRVPNGISPDVWECAWGWTLTAYGNVCFSEEHVRIEEMHRLREEVLPKLCGPVGPQTLVWIWERLAQTGPHGKRYVARFRQSFLDCFPPGIVREPPTLPGAPTSQRKTRTSRPPSPRQSSGREHGYRFWRRASALFTFS
jgi:hypothetical protein